MLLAALLVQWTLSQSCSLGNEASTSLLLPPKETGCLQVCRGLPSSGQLVNHLLCRWAELWLLSCSSLCWSGFQIPPNSHCLSCLDTVSSFFPPYELFEEFPQYLTGACCQIQFLMVLVHHQGCVTCQSRSCTCCRIQNCFIGLMPFAPLTCSSFSTMRHCFNRPSERHSSLGFWLLASQTSLCHLCRGPSPI